ncbi:MAG: DoxX family protein [Bacteroidota bacterium]
MNDKAQKIIYWTSTILMCAIFLFSASMYFMKTEMIKGYFEMMNYPPYLVYPLAIAKILGIIAVLSNKSKLLKEWAYAGFFFDAVLAAAAHLQAGDKGEMMSILAIVLTIISRYFWKRN